MRRASTVIKTVCAIVPLIFVWGCATGKGSSAGAAPDKADQALAAAQNALQEARAARASADAALAEARNNRAKLDEILATVKAGGGGDTAQKALDAAVMANQAAQEAKGMAEQAMNSAQKLNTKTDRMFEKAMRK